MAGAVRGSREAMCTLPRDRGCDGTTPSVRTLPGTGPAGELESGATERTLLAEHGEVIRPRRAHRAWLSSVRSAIV